MSKKGGKAAKETASYDTRDIVLGKVRGYPPWPGMVVDPDSVPPVVLKERPTTKKTQFYCVRFFPTGDFAWLVSKDISKLQPHEIQSYINEPNKKSGDLLQGYRIALDPTKWEEEREAESRLAAEEEANAEVDQLDSEEEEDAAASGDGVDDSDSARAKKSRKRKRGEDVSASVSVSSKAKKAPKRKDPADSSSSKKKSAAGAASKGGRKNGRKSNAMVESEEEDADNVAVDDGDGGPSKKGSPPPAKRARRDKDDDGDDAKISADPEAMKVRDWRHKLQKTFLSHKGHPREEDMPSIDALFTTVENYDRITIEYLQFSKIGKVMRHIAVLADDKVPRNAEFKFKDRADALVKKWQQILNANKPANGTGVNAADSLILSAAPISAVPTSVSLGGQEEAVVMHGTAAISLNGKPVDELPASTSAISDLAPVPAPIDAKSIVTEPSAQDVTMADAA